MNRDIFCKNCKYYRNDPNFRYPIGKNTGTDVHTVCDCQYNIDTHYGKKDPRRYISSPSIINRCHDCMWFEKIKRLDTYLWDSNLSIPKKYKDHGQGTYNINPENGIDGFYIGDKTLREIILDSQSQDIKDLKDRVDKIEVKVDQQDDKIIQLKNIVYDGNEKINEMDSKINKVKEKVQDLYNGNFILDCGDSDSKI